MSNDRPRTSREKDHFYCLIDIMNQLEHDLYQPILRQQALPAAWQTISRQRKISKKKRITIGIEEDVLKFFRGLGHPYQPRMNDVLRSFMHAKLAGVLARFPDLVDENFEFWAEQPRPKIGDLEKLTEEINRARGPRG